MSSREISKHLARTKVLANTANKFVCTFASIVDGLASSATDAADSLSGTLCNTSKGTLNVSLRSCAPSIRTCLFQVTNSTRGGVANIVSSLTGSARGTLSSIADGFGSALGRLVDLFGHRSRVAACRRVEFT
jgi:hypothetical protein